jgi:hypothetical protein
MPKIMCRMIYLAIHIFGHSGEKVQNQPLFMQFQKPAIEKSMNLQQCPLTQPALGLIIFAQLSLKESVPVWIFILPGILRFHITSSTGIPTRSGETIVMSGISNTYSNPADIFAMGNMKSIADMGMMENTSGPQQPVTPVSSAKVDVLPPEPAVVVAAPLGSGNDTVHGAGGNDDLNGFDGDDQVYGNEGDDTVRGGKGNDAVYGGKGNDRVYGQGR